MHGADWCEAAGQSESGPLSLVNFHNFKSFNLVLMPFLCFFS